jgi:hypothetical protein
MELKNINSNAENIVILKQFKCQLFSGNKVYQCILTPKILRNQIWIAGHFEQPLIYPYFITFSSNFLIAP